MSVESPPFALQAGSYGAEQTRRAIGTLLARGASIGSVAGGIVSAGDCALTPPGSGMSVNVAPGEVFVNGTSSATQSGYYCRVSATANIAIASADPSNPRIDRVSAIVADAAYVGVANTFSVAVETGTPTAGATLVNLTGVAAAPASSYTLGYVLVPAAATNIVAGDISSAATQMLPGMGGMVFRQGTTAAIPAASTVPGGNYFATDTATLYFSDGTNWRTVGTQHGSTNIPTSESRTNTAYGTLTTPDQVTGVVLPTNGLIAVWYQATWQESVAGAARAAIFVGVNQLQVAVDNTVAGTSAVQTQAAATGSGSSAVSQFLASSAGGLLSSQHHDTSGDVTTGQVVGILPASGGGAINWELGGTVGTTNQGPVAGPCYIFAAAATYTIAVGFKASSGSVTASNRKLWVQVLPFA